MSLLLELLICKLNDMKIAIALTFIVLVILFVLIPPIAQDPGYHQFADQRTLWGVAHFWNVLSNLPFVLVGVWGLWKRRQGAMAIEPALYRSNDLFFVAIILVGLGSARYHLNPSNASLVWDRLPMTLGFMAFFSLIVAEHHDQSLGLKCLWPALFLGMATVLYWHFTEQMGQGDLRPYAVIQFLPLFIIPAIIATQAKPYRPLTGLWLFLLCYALAKVLEFFDLPVYQVLGISGHSLKHVAAALGVYLYGIYLIRRKPSTI